VFGRESRREPWREPWRVFGREPWRVFASLVGSHEVRHEGSHVGWKPCRKHCLTLVMRSTEAYFEACRVFDRKLDKKLDKKLDREFGREFGIEP